MAKDYYSLLKIRRDATQDEVKRAYRRLARELHPDVNPDPETQERFKEITQAYEVLSDTDKRRMYDMGVDPFATAGTGAGAGPFGPGFSPLSDLLDQFFGGAGATTTRGPRSRALRTAWTQSAALRGRLSPGRSSARSPSITATRSGRSGNAPA